MEPQARDFPFTPDVAGCLKDNALECLSTPASAGGEPHQVGIALMTPFALVFGWATWLEFRRWWRYGPSRNRRSDFQFDEAAPSYETPRGGA